MEPRYAEIEELNGLGERVNELSRGCAGCRADKDAQFRNLDKRQDSQNGEIIKLFDKFDELSRQVNRALGGAAALVTAVGIIIIIVEKLWK